MKIGDLNFEDTEEGKVNAWRRAETFQRAVVQGPLKGPGHFGILVAMGDGAIWLYSPKWSETYFFRRILMGDFGTLGGNKLINPLPPSVSKSLPLVREQVEFLIVGCL